VTGLSFKTLFSSILLGAVLVAATLALCDIVLIGLDLFPPHYDYGEPDLGWAPFAPGKIIRDTCIDNVTGHETTIVKNEMGIRTSVGVNELRLNKARFKIAVVGDSQTELCAPNEETHPGVLEEKMRRWDENTTVLSYGRGRYSPLQAYLLFKKRLKQFNPQVFVMNFYTGNDFYDMLRVDDRPHFVESSSGYEIHRPVWLIYEDPSSEHNSRVLFILRTLLKDAGMYDLYVRLRFLISLAREQDQGLMEVTSYMNDLRQAVEMNVGYPAAFAAQMLNQQIFFYHFPRTQMQSVERVRYLMKLIREENPDVLLVMSPIPSYQLVQQKPVDEAFVHTLSRMPYTYEFGLRQEQELYYDLQRSAGEFDWLFIDNLRPLRNYTGPERLYNHFDYHVTPAASRIIGQNEAEVLLRYLNDGGTFGHKAPLGIARAGT